MMTQPVRHPFPLLGGGLSCFRGGSSSLKSRSYSIKSSKSMTIQIYENFFCRGETIGDIFRANFNTFARGVVNFADANGGYSSETCFALRIFASERVSQANSIFGAERHPKRCICRCCSAGKFMGRARRMRFPAGTAIFENVLWNRDRSERQGRYPPLLRFVRSEYFSAKGIRAFRCGCRFVGSGNV